MTKKPCENKVACCRHMGAFPVEEDEGVNTYKTIFCFIWPASDGIRVYRVQKSCTLSADTDVNRAILTLIHYQKHCSVTLLL